MRRQRAVLWTRSTEPDKFGKFTYAAPIEIRCRWEDIAKEFRDPKGQTVMSHSVVYVDRVIGVGDMLRLGEIETAEPSDPLDLPLTAFEVRQFNQLPNLRNKLTLYTAFL